MAVSVGGIIVALLTHHGIAIRHAANTLGRLPGNNIITR